jgi:hypothetical protein
MHLYVVQLRSVVPGVIGPRQRPPLGKYGVQPTAISSRACTTTPMQPKNATLKPTRKQNDLSLGSLNLSTSPCRCLTLHEPSRRSVSHFWAAHMRASTSRA